MTNVNTFYKAIIAEVIQKVSAEFINSGYEESTVRDLQALWEQKLNSSGSGSSATYEGSAFQAELSRYPQTNPINLPPMNIMTLVKPQPQFYTNSTINPLTMFQPQQPIFPPQMMIPRTAHMQPHLSVPIGQNLPLPHLQYQNYPHGLISKEQHNDQLSHYGLSMNAPLQQTSQQAPLRSQSQSINQVLNPMGPQGISQPYNMNLPASQQSYGMGINQQALNQAAPNQPLSSQQVLNQTYTHQLNYPNQQQNQSYQNAKNQGPISPEEEDQPNTPFQMFDNKLSPPGNTPNLPSLSPYALPQTPTPNKLPISAITPVQSTPNAPTATTPTQTTTSTTSTSASAPPAQAPPSNTKKSSWMKLKSEMNQKTQETKKNQEAPAPKASATPPSGGGVTPTVAKPKTPQQAPTPKNHNPPQEDEEDELRSDDDDESDEEPHTENLIVCTFDKVSRVKNKWKITLKCGVMNLNGRDYLFHRATGEGEW